MQPDPAENAAENPVEKGLHELGRQIDEATRTGGRTRTAQGQESRGGRRATRPRPRRPETALPQAHRGLGGGDAGACPRADRRRSRRIRLVPQP